MVRMCVPHPCALKSFLDLPIVSAMKKVLVGRFDAISTAGRFFEGAKPRQTHGGAGMAGQIKVMIDQIIEKKSKGNQAIAGAVKTKLILKGIRPEAYSMSSPDDPVIIGKLRDLAKEIGV